MFHSLSLISAFGILSPPLFSSSFFLPSYPVLSLYPLLFFVFPNSQAGDPACTSVRSASRKHARIFPCWHIVLWLWTTELSSEPFSSLLSSLALLPLVPLPFIFSLLPFSLVLREGALWRHSPLSFPCHGLFCFMAFCFLYFFIFLSPTSFVLCAPTCGLPRPLTLVFCTFILY
ncbi:hypothetical protein AMTRI_Chr09g36360 [Amborella trichopoda]